MRSGLVAPLRPWAEQLVAIAQRAFGGRAVVTSTRRSVAKQAQLYRLWKTGRSQYPAAAPGTSKHERGLAFDVGGLSSAELYSLGQLWESWGGRWGGRFSSPDPIHFEA